MVIVAHLPPGLTLAQMGNREEDSLEMTWEQRRWLRGKFITRKGRELALALPTGTVLDGDTILCVQPDWYVRVEAAPESVIVAKPKSTDEAIRLAFEIGNRHFSLAIEGDSLLVPDDIAMTQLFDRLQVAWERRRAVFSPLSQGYRHAP